MKMSELKQNLLKYELAKIGYPNAEYIPKTDIIKINPDNERAPLIDGFGEIIFRTEHRDTALNIIRPLAKKVIEICSEWKKAITPLNDNAYFMNIANLITNLIGSAGFANCTRSPTMCISFNG